MLVGLGGGATSDECTALLSDIPKGLKAVTKDSDDEPGIGTMEMTGSATDEYVFSGKTYYNTSYKELRTGTLTIASILSFNAAQYSTSQVLLSWQNPAKGPFGGVSIRYKTGSYPTSVTDGTLAYEGVGSNNQPSGISQQIIGGLTSGTTYYFTAWAYSNSSLGKLYSTVSRQVAIAVTSHGQVSITGTKTWTVPEGVRQIDVFCVGGGGNGSTCCGEGKQVYPNRGGCGGGGGYTATKKAIAVTPGQQYACTIGGAGAATKFGTLVTANGGGHASSTSGEYNNTQTCGKGGSGGGSSRTSITVNQNGAGGGSNGGAGGTASSTGGAGQGTTTRAFGESTGTLYSGGGGSGSSYGRHGGESEGIWWGGNGGGPGGSGGGGGGSTNGGANTGGGGGGQNRPHTQAYWPGMPATGSGGSGVILIRW